MRPVRVRGRRAAAAGVSILVLAGGVPAAAAYWDFSGWLYPFEYYGEDAGTAGSWYIRLSRQYCDVKMHLRVRTTGSWVQVNIPGGCATSDYTHPFSRVDYSSARCFNTGDGFRRVWTNCRVAAS